MGKNFYAAQIISEWETETTLMNAGTGIWPVLTAGIKTFAGREISR